MKVRDTIWRTYRGGSCLYFNLDAISRKLKHSWLNKRGLTWGNMLYKTGEPVIVYQRHKENPLKDKCFCGIITDQKQNLRRERHMLKVCQCNVEELTETEYRDILTQRKGTFYRKNFCIPYNLRMYKNCLEFLWQLRYLVTEAAYDFFPIDVHKPSTEFLGHIQGMDPVKFRETAIKAIGFDKKRARKDERRGYCRLNYKKIAREIVDARE